MKIKAFACGKCFVQSRPTSQVYRTASHRTSIMSHSFIHRLPDRFKAFLTSSDDSSDSSDSSTSLLQCTGLVNISKVGSDLQLVASDLIDVQ